MRKTAGLFVLAALLVLSCKQEKLDVPAPIKALIANSKDCACNPYVDKYIWRSQTVYLSSCGGPSCDCTTLYFDATGAPLQIDSTYSPDAFRQEAQLQTHVWRCQ